jgi:hypothetical protein
MYEQTTTLRISPIDFSCLVPCLWQGMQQWRLRLLLLETAAHSEFHSQAGAWERRE